MASAEINKHKEYSRYAAHCLNIVPRIKNQDDRIINHEMAAEWLRLADAALRFPGSKKLNRQADK